MKTKNSTTGELPTHGADESARAMASLAITGQWTTMHDPIPIHLPPPDEQDLLLAADIEGSQEDRVVDGHFKCFNCHFSTKRCVGCPYDTETEH